MFWKKEGEKRHSLETFYNILMGKYVLIFEEVITHISTPCTQPSYNHAGDRHFEQLGP